MTATVDAAPDGDGETGPATVRVWDPLVRVFHWSLVAAFATAWATGDEEMSVHELAGYVIVGLLVFRLAWGIVGSRHARFADFVYGPAAVIGFLRDSVILRARRYVGHNPAGGAMVIALLLTLAVITASGVMMTTDAFWGVRWVRETHETAVDVALVLVALHVAGVVLASIEHRENLVKAMITGRKRAQEAD
ncbi:MAG TPA: cytochrome b/b6 domain-containing protein [Bauldia sp.]|nr:cytochrome b/b6 domain-containing protein [Bauldia sp.]